MTRNIVFVCPHGAAKSVMAAAYFRQLADQQGLDYQASCAGTEPDAVVAPHVANLLQSEGVAFSAQQLGLRQEATCSAIAEVLDGRGMAPRSKDPPTEALKLSHQRAEIDTFQVRTHCDSP